MTSRRATKRDGGRQRPNYENAERRTLPLYDRETAVHIGYFDTKTGGLLTCTGLPSSRSIGKRKNRVHIKRAWSANRARMHQRAEYKINPA